MKGRVKNGTFFMHPFYLFERRISIPPLQVRRALSGGKGGMLMSVGVKSSH